MESWFCSGWIHFWMTVTLLGNISADPGSPPRYTVHQPRLSFEQAREKCFPRVLTSLATEQEVADVLALVSKSASPPSQTESTFWIGLKKVKNECVVATLPLRGFKWIENGREESEVNRWTEEPKHTCTTVRCAALKVEFNGTAVTAWGLTSVTCRNSYQSICKLPSGTPVDREGVRPATPGPAPPGPATPGPATPEPATPGPATPGPATPEPATPGPATPGPRPATQKPQSTTPELPPRAPGPETAVSPASEPASGSDSCQHPHIHGARSLSPDPDRNLLQVECWSAGQLQLRCSGRPAVWRLLNDSPANFSILCQPCETGFRKNATGNCVDIDECGSSPCRHTCVNTLGSFRCVCSDEAGNHHRDEDAGTCADAATNSDGGPLSGVLVPVLVAVAALVLLAVLVAVTVKCCLVRRAKKRAVKKADKMAMQGKDPFDTANEKAAI